MTQQSSAEEHLRIIRSLMEKATVYRTISAPGALVSGGLAITLAALGMSGSLDGRTVPFVTSWLVLLCATSTVNVWLLWRDARRRGEQFVSPGMKLALRAMVPGLLAGGVATLIEGDDGPALTAALWVLCYGLSLLSASHFAPKSIQWLGRAFFVAGASLLIARGPMVDPVREVNQVELASLIMGLTFGVFHLIYGLCILSCNRANKNRTP
jgi:hypothetical protein